MQRFKLDQFSHSSIPTLIQIAQPFPNAQSM